jgi:hypothetical protein
VIFALQTNFQYSIWDLDFAVIWTPLSLTFND